MDEKVLDARETYAYEKFQNFCRDELNYELVTTSSAIEEIVDFIYDNNIRRVAIDMETTSLIASQGAIRLLQIGVCEQGISRQWIIDCFETEVGAVRKLLEDNNIVKLIHYSPFEVNWALVHWQIKIVNIFDSQVAWKRVHAKLLTMPADEAESLAPHHKSFGNSLHDLALYRLELYVPKEEGGSDWAHELRREQLDYAAADVALLFALADDAQEVAAALDIDDETIEEARQFSVYWVHSNDRLQYADEFDAYKVVHGMLSARPELPSSDDAVRQQLAKRLRRFALTYNSRRKLLDEFTPVKTSL